MCLYGCDYLVLDSFVIFQNKMNIRDGDLLNATYLAKVTLIPVLTIGYFCLEVILNMNASNLFLGRDNMKHSTNSWIILSPVSQHCPQ